MKLNENWPAIKRVFDQAFRSSFHYAIATINEDGEPHVTPIGSLFLCDPGRGFYFEEFTQQLPCNFQYNKQVSVLAVNSSRWFWLKSLFLGKFLSPPAIRLYGTAGEVRAATSEEIKLWQHRVKQARYSKGYALLWANMKMVRDINFSRVEPVHLGKMTRDVWKIPI